jgi:hypothetical protein
MIGGLFLRGLVIGFSLAAPVARFYAMSAAFR